MGIVSAPCLVLQTAEWMVGHRAIELELGEACCHPSIISGFIRA